jgi:predicted O-methyltransferase YrrM
MPWPTAAIEALRTRPATAEEAADQQRCEAARAALAQSTELIGDMSETRGADPSFSVAEESARASSPAANGLFLYRLVRALRPAKVVEFGSAVGVSGSYLASALRANGSGHLVTVEGAPSRQRIAQRTIESVAPGVTTSRCAVFEDALDALDEADVFFLDGHHHYDPTLHYVAEACARMRRPAVLVLDDVANHSERMDRAWQDLAVDPRFAHAQLFDRIGLLALGEPEWHDLPSTSLLDRLRRR